MVKDIDLLKYTSDELKSDKLADLIAKRASFKVVAVKDIAFVVNKIGVSGLNG